MADFCRQCSLEMFGEDLGDLAGISTPEQTDNKEFAVVICEGCGLIVVDHLGHCMTIACLEKHGAGKWPAS